MKEIVTNDVGRGADFVLPDGTLAPLKGCGEWVREDAEVRGWRRVVEWLITRLLVGDGHSGWWRW